MPTTADIQRAGRREHAFSDAEPGSAGGGGNTHDFEMVLYKMQSEANHSKHWCSQRAKQGSAIFLAKAKAHHITPV